MLLLSASAFTIVLVAVQIRRCNRDQRQHRNPILWVVGVLLVVLSGVSVIDSLASTALLRTAGFSRPLDLFNANLRALDLRRVNLEGANLIEADLSEADLRGSNLSGANLSYADLTSANLSVDEVRLQDRKVPDFTGKNVWADVREPRPTVLIGTIFIEATLTGADLSGAVLISADFDGANLTGAILYRADIYGTNLLGANLDRPIYVM